MNLFQLSLRLILFFFDAVSLCFSTFSNKRFARPIYFKSVCGVTIEIYIYTEPRIASPVSRIHPRPELLRVEGVRLEWNTFIGIFENLEKKAAKYMQKHENKLKIL